MRFRIVRQTTTLNLVHGAGVNTVATPATNAAGALVFNGLLQGILYTAPAAVDGAATVTFSLIDQDGNTVWSKGSVAAAAGTTQVYLTPNATAGTNQAITLSGTYQIQAVYSANQTSTDSTTKVVLLIDEG